MSIGRSLPVIQVEPSRRRVLLLGIASVGVACGPAARPGTYDASPGDLDATASAAEVSVAPRDVVADEPDASGGDARSPDAPGPDARVLDVAADEGGEPDASAADVGAPGEDRPDAPPPGDLAALDAPACPADAVRLGALTLSVPAVKVAALVVPTTQTLPSGRTESARAVSPEPVGAEEPKRVSQRSAPVGESATA
jgi:hypothetical protein